MARKSKQISNEHLQDLVNAQVDINRAVWAGNDIPSHFTEAQRDAYLVTCAELAIRNLQDFLKKQNNLLF